MAFTTKRNRIRLEELVEDRERWKDITAASMAGLAYGMITLGSFIMRENGFKFLSHGLLFYCFRCNKRFSCATDVMYACLSSSENHSCQEEILDF